MIKSYLVSNKPTSKKIKTFFIEEKVLSLSPLVKIKSITHVYKLGRNNINFSFYINDKEMCINRNTFENLSQHAIYELNYIQHVYDINNNIATLNIYQNHSLTMIVNIEFDNEEKFLNFKKPYWFGMDVTDIDEYSFEYILKN